MLVDLTPWQIAALEVAVRARMPYFHADSGKALLEVLSHAGAVQVQVLTEEPERPDYRGGEEPDPGQYEPPGSYAPETNLSRRQWWDDR